MKELIKRSITGAIFVAILVLGILWNVYSLLGLFLVISFIGNLEFLKFARIAKAEPHVVLSSVVAVSSFSILVSVAAGWLPTQWTSIIVALVLLVFIVELFRQKPDPLRNIAFSILGVVYSTIPFVLLALIAIGDGGTATFTGELVLGMFVLLWIYDSSAYIVGVNFGKNRLYEKVSPKKSWEGAIGGLIITLAVAWLVSSYLLDYSLGQCLSMAAIVGVFGTMGDLTESMFKRAVGVKDSGNILPGHGGILDRFDAMLFISPIVWIYLQWI